MMKLADVLWLSWAGLVGHKKRNRLVILTIVVMFCLVFIVNLTYQGLENSIINVSATKTDGAVYIKTGLVEDYYYHPSYGKLLAAPLPENAQEIIAERVQDYHGEVVGTVSYTPAEQEWEYDIISQSAVTEFVEEEKDFEKVAVVRAEGVQGEINQEFQAVGAYPNTALGKLKTDNVLFASVLEKINPGPRDMLVVDDGSEAFSRYLDEQNMKWREVRGYDFDPEPTMLVVAKFANAKDAADYYANTPFDGLKYGYDLAAGYQYVVQDLFNNTVSVAMAFTFYRIVLLVMSGVFLVFAIWITVLTFSHIADEDVATIALYRAMGARARDIYLIYGVYLLELCVVALAICWMLAFLSAGAVALFSANSLAETLQGFYQLATPASVGFWGLNETIVIISGAMIAIAPITLLFVGRKFSARQIAKKLKEGL